MTRRWKWLLVVLASSALLNTWGITWGLPERWHPDEITQRAENMVGTPSLNPHFFVYGGLHHYVIAALAVLPVKVPNKLLHLMDYDTQSTVVVTLSRLLSVSMGTGVVLLTFLIGEGLFDRRTGLLAAALLSTCMLLVNLSHFATVDVPSLFWFGLACLMATHVFRSGRRRSYLLAGLCSGLAAAVKFVGGLSFLAFLAAHFLGRAGDNPRTQTTEAPRSNLIGTTLDGESRSVTSSRFSLWYLCLGAESLLRSGARSHRLLAGALLMAAAGFVLGNPVLLFAPLEFVEGFFLEMRFASFRGMDLPRAFLPLVLQLKDALGAPLFVLSLAGLVHSLRLLASRQNRPAALLALSMILPYYLVTGSMRGPRAGPLLGPLPPLRYTLPLLPFLLLFAAKMLGDLLAARRRDVRALAVALSVTVLCYSAAYSAAAALKFTRDSRYDARAWVLANLQPGAVIETTSYGPDLPRDRYTLIERPHDNQIAEIAAAVAERDLRLQTAIARLRAWLEAAGLPATAPPYEPWYRKAVARHAREASNFDPTIHGLEARAPDALVVSDLYFLRFRDGAGPEAEFFSNLFSGKTSYRNVADFHYELPTWLDPPAEFVNPRISVYSRVPTRPKSNPHEG